MIWVRTSQGIGTIILSLVLVSSLLSKAASQSVASRAQLSGTPMSPAVAANASRYRPNPFSKRAREYYELYWGVDSLATKYVESGEMIRFGYRVLDTEKAKALNDKKAEPYLIDQRAHVKLVIPSLEQVGQLRQSSAPEVGKAYWMVFSNKGRLVKPGDRVDVVIGRFRASGLLVQ